MLSSNLTRNLRSSAERLATMRSTVLTAGHNNSKMLPLSLQSPFFLSFRTKHSSTQVKRLFNRHPARIRVEERMGIDRTPVLPPPPKFAPIFEPDVFPNGWSAPPAPDVTLPDYPFQVLRTRNKPNDSVGFLPVYTKYRYVRRIQTSSCSRAIKTIQLTLWLHLFSMHGRKDGTKVITRVKKIVGDRDSFEQELRSVLQLPMSAPVRVRVGGTIEVDGNHAREVREWLAGLGF
jgi:hypothetical protein